MRSFLFSVTFSFVVFLNIGNKEEEEEEEEAEEEAEEQVVTTSSSRLECCLSINCHSNNVFDGV